LYVTYAMQNANRIREVTGAGLGYVNVFDLSGNLVSRFASAGALNVPWGVAVAPSGFGSIASDVLIGNFGDGTINIFMPNGRGLREAPRGGQLRGLGHTGGRHCLQRVSLRSQNLSTHGLSSISDVQALRGCRRTWR
jgi:hypothetical protein